MTLPESNRRQQGRNLDDFPCHKERSQSMKCIVENNYDYDKCNKSFDNFKLCLAFWNDVKKLRNTHNIKPSLPPPEERDKIKELYLKTGKFPDYAQKKS